MATNKCEWCRQEIEGTAVRPGWGMGDFHILCYQEEKREMVEEKLRADAIDEMMSE